MALCSQAEADDFLKAAEQPNHACILNFLKRYPKAVDIKDNHGFTALILATRKKNADTVSLLIDAGAALDEKNNDGWTALILACGLGLTDIAGLLIEKGAQVDKQGYNGFTPLMLAAWNGHDDIVNLLLDNNADVAIRDNDNLCVMDHLLIKKRNEGIVTLIGKWSEIQQQQLELEQKKEEEKAKKTRDLVETHLERLKKRQPPKNVLKARP